MKTLRMVGGMPRSGSTLLMNILAQNPDIYATPSSGLLDVCMGVRNHWNRIEEHRANLVNSEFRLPRVIRGVIQSYYSNQHQDIIVDKCRAWPAVIEVFESILDEKLRIVVPVRDVRDVLSSFEKLWRIASTKGLPVGEADNLLAFQTLQGRCDFWMKPDQLTGLAITRIVDAVSRGLRDRMLFVDYDEMCSDPASTLANIYNFWDMPIYKGHSFKNVRQATHEDDSAYGYGDLHTIRPVVERQETQWPQVLGALGAKYDYVSRFWEKL